MSTPLCHNCSGALGGLDIYWSYLCLKSLPFWAGFRVFPSLHMDPGINWRYSRIRRTVEQKSIILWRLWATMRAYEAYMATLGLQGTGWKGVILPPGNFTQARANKLLNGRSGMRTLSIKCGSRTSTYTWGRCMQQRQVVRLIRVSSWVVRYTRVSRWKTVSKSDLGQHTPPAAQSLLGCCRLQKVTIAIWC